jgi:hypothetical protein
MPAGDAFGTLLMPQEGRSLLATFSLRI